MRFWILLGIFLVLTLYARAQDEDEDQNQDEGQEGEARFDCGRYGVACNEEGGECDYMSGLCNCIEDYEGVFCQINKNETEEVDAGICDPICNNGGTCLKTGGEDGTTSCLCPEKFFGDYCDMEKVSHVCKHDSVSITIVPDVGPGGKFEGLVYVDEQDEDEDCELENDGQGKLTKDIPLDSCGGATMVNETDGTERHSFTVVVQYDPDVREITDERYSFTCEFLPPGSNIEGDTNLLSPRGVEEDKYNPPEEVKKVLQPFDVILVDEEGEPLTDTSQVQLGKVIQLKILLNGGIVYSSFRVETVESNNGRNDSKILTLPLVSDSCPHLVQKGKVIEFYNTTAPNDEGKEVPAVFLKFRTFRFRYSTIVNFHLKIKVCKEEKECQPKECDGDLYAGIGRKKRDVSDSNSKTFSSVSAIFEEYDASIIIVEKGNTLASVLHPASHPAERMIHSKDHFCMTRLGLIVTVVLVVFLVLLTTTTAICACVRIMHITSHRDDIALTNYENPAYTCEKL